MAFTRNSSIRQLMNNDQARAVVEKHVPGASTHPQLSEAMYMTLGEVAGYPESGLTAAKLQALLDDLAAVSEE